jgi:hypothetical protein
MGSDFRIWQGYFLIVLALASDGSLAAPRVSVMEAQDEEENACGVDDPVARDDARPCTLPGTPLSVAQATRKVVNCHPVRCEEITRDAMGSFIWHGYKFGTVARFSQDDSCHICIQINPNVPSVVEPHCIFLRPDA